MPTILVADHLLNLRVHFAAGTLKQAVLEEFCPVCGSIAGGSKRFRFELFGFFHSLNFP